MLAIREAYRAGFLAPPHWMSNIVAGVIVGVVALPLAMAFAIASGVKPEQGLYTAIVAGLAVSVFGGSRIQIAGPTGAFIVILSGIVAEHGVDGLQIATLMAGMILLLFGIARMGAVIRFIPAPVIIGFTAGIGVVIWVGQWRDFFGLPAIEGHYFHEKLWALFQAFPQFDPVTTMLGLLSLALVIGNRWIPYLRKVPGPLLALVIVTGIQSVFGFQHVATIGSTFGDIPRGLPTLAWPDLSMDRVLSLVGPAFAIAMLGAIESLLSAVVADSMAGTRHNSNQELVGQGIANILSPLFGGIAATGAIARTATNIRNGGTSPLAGIVHALTLVLVLIALASLARNIPLATLAAILFVVAWNMSEARRFIRLVRKAPRADVVILLVTFLLTVFADLVVAVNIGVVLAVLHFLRRMADSVDVHIEPEAQLRREFMYAGFDGLPAGIKVYRIDGPFFFAAIERFRESLSGEHPQVLILRLDNVPFADATALQALEETVIALQARAVRVMLVGANGRVTNKLARMGLRERLGAGNLQPGLMQALHALRD
ncbi:MAG: STAS domain-containing protein [Alcaligenaceae bacterium]|nr:STAS domain-containing protein [Alcaligenaceae bacterium]